MNEIELHPAQSLIYESLFVDKTCRYAVGTCARGFGKSFLAGVAAITAVSELVQMPSDVPNKDVYIIAPTYDQVVDIYHPLIAYQLGMDDYALKHSKDAGRFWFPNNTTLRLLSYESVERMRGKGAYFVVGDEVSSWSKGIGFKEAWESVIQPCITTRWSPANARKLGAPNPGRALIISTPKGYNYLYDMSTFPETDPDWKAFHFDYTKSPYLDPEEIEKVKHNIDPLKFAREYMASYADSGASVFYCFDRKIHVRQDLEDFNEEETVHVGIDFNIGIMASVIFAIRGNQVHILDDLQGAPNTEALAITLKGRYPNKKIIAYPDPTGQRGVSSAAVGQTDFSILRSFNIQTLSRPGSPPIIDSVAAVNRKLKTAAGDTSLYVHPRAQNAIKSLERTVWVDKNPNTASIDKTEGIEHWSDAVRYPIEFLYPVLDGTRRTTKGFNF
jgi:hypothetical protein